MIRSAKRSSQPATSQSRAPHGRRAVAKNVEERIKAAARRTHLKLTAGPTHRYTPSPIVAKMFATTGLIVLAALAPHAFALPNTFRRPPSNIRRSADTNSTGVFGPDSNLWAQMTPYYPVADYVPPPSNCEIDQVSTLFRSNRGHEARRLVARGWEMGGHASHGARLRRVLCTQAARMAGRTFVRTGSATV